VDPPLPLLQVHRVGGEVPVADVVTVGVEVQAFLPDGGGGQDKGPEGGVEGAPDQVLSDLGFVLLVSSVPEAEGKAAPNAVSLEGLVGRPLGKDLVMIMIGSCFLGSRLAEKMIVCQ
jgi:hypothetical protein